MSPRVVPDTNQPLTHSGAIPSPPSSVESSRPPKKGGRGTTRRRLDTGRPGNDSGRLGTTRTPETNRDANRDGTAPSTPGVMTGVACTTKATGLEGAPHHCHPRASLPAGRPEVSPRGRKAFLGHRGAIPTHDECIMHPVYTYLHWGFRVHFVGGR